MNEQKSFRPSDFSLREIPGFIVIYIIISLVSVATGFIVEQLPDIWKGALLGLGVGLIAALIILRLRTGKKTD